MSGVEYFSPQGSGETRDFSAFQSLAEFLGVSMAGVLAMRDRNQLGDAIKKRNAQKDAEKRSAGYLRCAGCGGAVRPRSECACGTVAPGSTLTGAEAMRVLMSKPPL